MSTQQKSDTETSIAPLQTKTHLTNNLANLSYLLIGHIFSVFPLLTTKHKVISRHPFQVKALYALKCNALSLLLYHTPSLYKSFNSFSTSVFCNITTILLSIPRLHKKTINLKIIKVIRYIISYI